MPTSFQIAGIKRPKHVQFKSLMPMIQGKAKKNYSAIYGGYTNLQRMITADGYKMIYYPKIDKTLLYNLKTDPMEMKNIADDPSNSRLLNKLRKQLKKLQAQVGDKLELEHTPKQKA